MLFPCPEGSVVGKSFQSEVEVRLKAKSKCEMRPEVSPEAAKIALLYRFRPQRLTLITQHRSKKELLELARPCCFAVLKAAFWEALTPGHAVSLSRRKRCWEVFPVRCRGASQS